MRLSVISLQVTKDHEGTRVKEREMSILTGRVAYWHPVKTVVCKKSRVGGKHGPEALLVFEMIKFHPWSIVGLHLRTRFNPFTVFPIPTLGMV